jgi:c-di-GMP phosphodiesterase
MKLIYVKHYFSTLLPLIFLIGSLLFILLYGRKEKSDILERREVRFSEILQQTELQFSSFSQLMATLTSLSDELPLTREAHEIFLNKLFSSSRTELLYGMGIWYEPDRFQKGITRYGPYIHLDDPEGSSYSLSYKWNTPEYDYQSQRWYKTLSQTKPGVATLTSPYFDTDYTYMTFGSSFYRDGVFQGVVTIDMVLPRLTYFMEKLDRKGFDRILLTDKFNYIMYNSDSQYAPGDPFPEKSDNDLIFTRSSKVLPFVLSASISRKTLFKEMSRTRMTSLVILGLWLISLATYFIFASGKSHYRQNILLNSENRALKNEIELRKKAELQLQFLAYHDPVTKLENFRAMKETVSPPRERDENRHLIELSLDNIAELSSVLERDFIDNLLRAFTVRLKENLPSSARLFRGRGFSFFILCPSVLAPEAEALAGRIQEVFRNKISFNQREVRLRVSIGLTPFTAGDSLDFIINQSHLTMTGRERSANFDYNGIMKFNSGLNKRRTEKMMLDSAMESSAFLDELTLYYQPIMKTADRTPAGYEALARWHNKRLDRFISPDEFIPLAEENGHIIDLGWFVIEEVLKKLEKSGREASWYITVNVSPVQFIESDFAEKLDSLVQLYGVSRHRFKLEITETSAAGNFNFFWTGVEKLHRAGYLLVMDDFGTGESSLGRLQSIPFDTLKLDKVFIRTLKDDQRQTEIIRSFVSLARALNTKVIAEGVERDEEHELLRSLDVDFTQGFLYSPPRPWDQLEALGFIL